MVDLGSVSIRITPDIVGFQRALKTAEKTASMDVAIEFDKTQVRKGITTLEKTLQDIDVKFEADPKSLAGLAASVEAVEKSLPELDIIFDVDPKKLSATANTGILAANRGLTELQVGFDVDATRLAAEAAAAVKTAQAVTPDLKVGMDTRGIHAALAGVSSRITGIAGSLARLTALGAAGVAAIGAGGLGAILVTGFRSLQDHEVALAALNQTIKSTGGVAKVSAKEVEALASDLSSITGFSSTAVINTEGMLLRFTKIRDEVGKNNDIFTQATGLALDFSRAFKVDPEKAAIQLGKALNDPIRGLTLLGRRGITFTEQQKKMIEGFVQQGDLLSAQKIVVEELTTRIGGQAAALGNTLPIALQKTQVAFAAFSRSVVEGASPAIVDLLNKIQELFRTGTGGSGDFAKSITNLVTSIAGVFERLIGFIRSADFATFLGSMKTAFENVVGSVKAFGTEFAKSFSGGDEQQSFIVSLGEAFIGFSKAIAFAAPIIGKVLGVISKFVADHPKLVSSILLLATAATAITAFALFFKPLINVIGFVVKGLFQIITLKSALAKGAPTGFQRFLVNTGNVLKSIIGFFGRMFLFVGRIVGSLGRVFGVFTRIGSFVARLFLTVGRFIPLFTRIAFFTARFATPIGAIISIVILLLLKFKPVRDIIKTIAGLIKDVLVGAFNILKDTAGAVIDGLKKGLDKITFGLTDFGDESKKTAEKIKINLGGLDSVIGQAQKNLDSLVARQKADKRVGEAIKANISDAQVEALKRNKRLAEMSSDDINAAFRRIGRVAVSTGFRHSLQRSLGGLLDQVRFIRERININLRRIGMVNASGVFADTIIQQASRVLSFFGSFSNTMVAIVRTMMNHIVSLARSGMSLFSGAFRVNGIRISRTLRFNLENAVQTIRGFEDEFYRAGKLLIQGFQDGMEKAWEYTAFWLAGREQVIRDLKGPLAYDKTILYEAGQAVMGGFQTGLETAWTPIQGWLSSRGSLMKGLIGTSSVSDLAENILLGRVDDPAAALAGLEPDTPRFWTSYADMLSQAGEIAKMFNLSITSTFRDLASNIAAGGAKNSYHTQGRAVDFAGSTGNMDALADWAEEFRRFFVEILWRTVGHFDHVHLAWQLASAMNLPRREKGGSVLAGQSYLVGERGAEIFTPAVTGRIHSNHDSKQIMQQSGATYNPVYNVNASGLNAQSVQSLLARRERLMLRRIGLS